MKRIREAGGDEEIERAQLKYIRAIIRAGFPMTSQDYRGKMPIEYLIDTSTCSEETFTEVLLVHLRSGFNILERPNIQTLDKRR